MKKTAIIISVAALIVLAYFVFSPAKASSKQDGFAQCLTEKGAKFYGAFWCPHCDDQKEMFGKSIKFVNYVECSTQDGRGQLQVCKDAGIQGYPTWTFADGSRLVGVQTFQALSDKTGCPFD